MTWDEEAEEEEAVMHGAWKRCRTEQDKEARSANLVK